MTIESYGEREVVTIAPSENLSEAAAALGRSGVGSVVVVDGAEPIGLLSDRDLSVAVLVEGLDPHGERVDESMATPLVTIDAGADLREAVALMKDHGVRRLPVVRQGELCGIVTADDLVSALVGELMAVESVIADQSRERKRAVAWRSSHSHFEKTTLAVPESATAENVARGLYEEAVGCAVVSDSSRRPVGILTDRDLVTRALDRPEARARELMSHPLVTIESEAPLEKAVGLMQQHSVRRIPVLRDGQLSGLISLDDILVAIGRELSDLGTAFRHAIARSQREQRLERLQSEMRATLDRSVGRAEELGEASQDRLAKLLEGFTHELRDCLR